MKPHKYREELQNRTISPSSDSWEKLNKKLSSHEKNSKSNRWVFLKVASVILVFISVGFYFLKQEDETRTAPIIAAPASKEKFNEIPVKDDVIETEIATIPNTSTSKKKIEIQSNRKEVDVIKVAMVEPMIESETSTMNQAENIMIDSLSKVNSSSEIADSKAGLIDDEIEQLLYKSKIKLIVNGQISSQKLVNADALLNSVEEDLNKSLKQKFLEKIVSTIKKDKEVVSSKEN